MVTPLRLLEPELLSGASTKRSRWRQEIGYIKGLNTIRMYYEDSGSQDPFVGRTYLGKLKNFNWSL